MHIDACYTYTLLPATRFAVPFFFMVTGYFIGDQSKKKDWKKYIIHALLLLLGAITSWLVCDITLRAVNPLSRTIFAEILAYIKKI